VGTILIARQLGKTRFDAGLRSFGFGASTGLRPAGARHPAAALRLQRHEPGVDAGREWIAVTAMQLWTST
jgi:hypothetical protein